MKQVKETKILIDIGSSTVKVYEFSSGSLKLKFNHSISFKENFDPDKGISKESKKELYELIFEVKNKYPKSAIKLYATALYRKLSPEARREFIDEFFEKTGLFFNIIEHDLENFYLQVALVGKYENTKEPLLLINIGGGSTELVIMFGKEAVETKNIEVGVGTILTEFEGINEKISKIGLKKNS